MSENRTDVVRMPNNTGKKSFFGAFAITDRTSCEKAIRNGGIAAMTSVIFLLFYVTAMRGTCIRHKSYKQEPRVSVA